MSDNPIYVTRPFLPPIEEFKAYIDGVWDRNILTNGGPLHQELESKLCDYLGIPYISLFNNCTIGLMAVFPVLGITEGEVITTPFTFMATAHAIMWNNLKPVFVDIDPNTLNIDPKKIAEAITPQTKAILAVHCYGRPCDVQVIQSIADKHHLKVIYDAAHIFGVEDENGGVGRHGDMAVLSFHATKVFNTFEGGAIICHDKQTKEAIDRFKNFGIVNENNIDSIGLNGKLSEVHAAMGLAQLPYINTAILNRKKIYERYHEELANISGLKLPNYSMIQRANYSYFPVIINDHFLMNRDELFDYLKTKNIFARKYFYPLITDLAPYFSYKTECPISDEMSRRVLCLPIYPDMTDEEQTRVIEAFKKA